MTERLISDSHYVDYYSDGGRNDHNVGLNLVGLIYNSLDSHITENSSYDPNQQDWGQGSNYFSPVPPKAHFDADRTGGHPERE